MSIDMERARDGFRGRYRDRHNGDSTHRDNPSTRGNNYRGGEHQSHSEDHHSSRTNGNYSSRTSPANYNCRSSRSSLNARPVLSRAGPSAHERHHPTDSHLVSSATHRNNNVDHNQVNYYETHPPLSRFDRETYPSLLDEQQSIMTGNRSLLPSPYHGSLALRDRGLPYIESERDRYPPAALPIYRYVYLRRESLSPPPPSSTYRHERSMEYASRSTSNDLYGIRDEYRSLTPPILAPPSMRSDPYGDTYRANDYNNRSGRYEMLTSRTNSSSCDYQMASIPSSVYRPIDPYRNSSGVSSIYPHVPSPVPIRDVHYRQSSDYGMSPRLNYSSVSPSAMDYQTSLARNARDRNVHDSRSSTATAHRDRQNLKRSGSRHDDNGPIPAKRAMRR